MAPPGNTSNNNNNNNNPNSNQPKKSKQSKAAISTASDTNKKATKKPNGVAPKNRKQQPTKAQQMKQKGLDVPSSSKDKVKKVKTAQAPAGESKIDIDKSDSVTDNNVRPRLVPPATMNWNIVKRVMADIYIKQESHKLYHLWLDCLYDPDVTIEMILEGLKPLFGKLKRNDIQARHIYIVASQPSDDLPPVPAGSCFIMISEHLINHRAKSLSQFELKILYNKMHMLRVKIPMLREQLKDQHSLVFTEAFLNLLELVPVHLLRHAMDQSDETTYKLETKQSKKQQKVPRESDTVAKEIYILDGDSKLTPRELDAVVKDMDGDSELALRELEAVAKDMDGDSKLASLLIDPSSIIDVEELEADSLRALDEFEDKIMSPPDDSFTRIHQHSSRNVLGSSLAINNISPEFDEQLWKMLKGRGQIVLRVNNLPGNLTIPVLNAMLQTYSLNSDQIVGLKRKKGVIGLLDLYIVMHPNHPDLPKILSKHGCQTFDSILSVVQTNFDELRKFLIDHHGHIHRFEKDDKNSQNVTGPSSAVNDTGPEFDEQLFSSLKTRGQAVICVNNLPAKLTVQALNLMMGTYSLNSDQIVGFKRKEGGYELMNIRIVMHPDNLDLSKILSKHGCQTYYGSILSIERTDFRELRQFLINHRGHIHRLDNYDKLPIKSIGYSRDQDVKHKSFKITIQKDF